MFSFKMLLVVCGVFIFASFLLDHGGLSGRGTHNERLQINNNYSPNILFPPNRMIPHTVSVSKPRPVFATFDFNNPFAMKYVRCENSAWANQSYGGGRSRIKFNFSVQISSFTEKL